MAFFTRRNIAVFVGVAQGAIQNGMFFAAGNKFLIHLGMAACTDIVGDVVAVCLAQRRVNGMTGFTGGIVAILQMRCVMTLGALGDIAVASMVAVGAGQVRMCRRVFMQFLGGGRVAGGTVRREPFHVSQAGDRGVGIRMTGQTVGELAAVGLLMAALAGRNFFRPGHTLLEVMKGLVTKDAFQLMAPTAFLDVFKDALMTFGTFDRCHGGDFLLIHIVGSPDVFLSHHRNNAANQDQDHGGDEYVAGNNFMHGSMTLLGKTG